MLSKGGGTMSLEEVTIAEPPENADTGQTTIAGCSKVDIAVANVDGIVGER